MSTEIDNKIVEMRFDNQQFERETERTMSTIDKLKEKLNFKGTEESLEKLSKSANQVKFDNMADGIETISNRFTMMGRIANDALERIANKIVDVGVKMAKSLTVTPMMDGWNEYNLKMDSMKTILANMNTEEAVSSLTEAEKKIAKEVAQGKYGNGFQRKQALESLGYDYDKIQTEINRVVAANGDLETSFDDVSTATVDANAKVNNILDELNTYADKTVYNFAQMTNAIGKFTTAGVDVQQAATAVKGLSNLAAVAGADNAALSRTYIQVAQALNTGTMMLQDWRSLENANMATMQFQDVIKETAREYGVAVDEIIASEGSFRLSLSKGWLTNDILIKSLEKYADETTEFGQKAYDAAQQVRTFGIMLDQIKESLGSGWGKTFEILVGDMDEATDFWTHLSNAITGVIDPINDARNSVLTFWKAAGGRTMLANTIYRSLNQIKDIFSPLSLAMNKIVGNFSIRLWIVNLTQKVDDLSYAITRNIRTWKDLGGVENAAQGIKNIFDFIKSLITPIKEAFIEVFNPKIVVDFGKGLAEGSAKFENFTEKLKVGEGTIKAIKNVSTGFFTTIKKILGLIKPIAGVVLAVASAIAKLTGNILTLIFGTEEAKDKLKDNKVYYALSKIFSALGNVIKSVVNAFSSLFKRLSNMGILDKLKTKAIQLWNVIKPFGSLAVDKLVGALDKLASKEIKFPTADQIADSVERADSKWTKFVEALKKTKNDIVNWFRGVDNTGTDDGEPGFVGKLINSIESAFNDPMGTLNKAHTNIRSFLSVVGEDLSAFFHWILDSGALEVAMLGAGVYTLINLGEMFKTIKNGGLGLSAVFKSVSGFFSGMTKAVKTFFTDAVKAYIVTEIAKAIALFSVSLGLLARVNPDDLVNATLCLSLIMVAFGKVLEVINSGNAGHTASRFNVNLGLGLAILGIAKLVQTVMDSFEPFMQAAMNTASIGRVAAFILTIIGTVTAITISAAFMLKVANKVSSSGKELIGLGAMFAGLSLVVKPIVNAIKDLSKIDTGKLWAMTGTFSVILIAMTAVTGFLSLLNSKFTRNTGSFNNNSLTRMFDGSGSLMKNIISFSILATSVATAMLIIAKASEKMANIDASGFNRAIKMVAVVLGGLAAIALSAGLAKGLLSLSAVLIGLVAPIVAITYILPNFKDSLNGLLTVIEQHKGLVTTALIIAGVVNAIMLVIGLSDRFNKKINKFATAVMKFGVGFLAFSAGLVALGMVSDKLPSIVDNIFKSINVLGKYKNTLAKAASGVVAFVIAKILISLMSAKAQFVLRATAIVIALANAIYEYKDIIIPALTKTIDAIGMLLTELTPTIVYNAVNIVTVAVSSVIKALEDNAPAIGHSLIRILSDIGIMVLSGTNLLWKIFDGLGNAMSQALGSDKKFDMYGYAMGGVEQLKNSRDELMEIWDTEDAIQRAERAAERAEEALVDGSETSLKSVSNLLSGASTKLSSFFGSTGEGAATSLVEGFMSTDGITTDDMLGMLGMGDETQNEVKKTASELGTAAKEYNDWLSGEDQLKSQKGFLDESNANTQEYLQSIVKGRQDAANALSAFMSEHQAGNIGRAEYDELTQLAKNYNEAIKITADEDVLISAQEFANDRTNTMIEEARNYIPTPDETLTNRLRAFIGDGVDDIFITADKIEAAVEKVDTVTRDWNEKFKSYDKVEAQEQESTRLPKQLKDGSKLLPDKTITVVPTNQQVLRQLEADKEYRNHYMTDLEKINEAIDNHLQKVTDNDEAIKNEITKSNEAFARNVDATVNKTNEYLGPLPLDMYNGTKEAGENFVQGFSDGIASKKPTIDSQIKYFGSASIQMLKRSLDEHSPSKATALAGEYFVDGFTNAIDKFTSKAEKATGNLGTRALNSMMIPIKHVQNILTGKSTLDTSIRPMINLDQVRKTSGTIEGMINKKNISIAGLNGKLTADVADSISGVDFNNDGVMSEINALRSEVSTLKDVIGNMTVVMDTGAVVGTLAAPMDNALGQRAIRKGRRN